MSACKGKKLIKKKRKFKGQNKRNKCLEILSLKEKKFMFHQEYTTSDWNNSKSESILAESHFKACSYANVKLSAHEALQFQVGPTEGIDAADNLWMARFILYRVAEDYGIVIRFDPKLTAVVETNEPLQNFKFKYRSSFVIYLF